MSAQPPPRSRMKLVRDGLITAVVLGALVALVRAGIEDDIDFDAFVADPANGCKVVSVTPVPGQPTLHTTRHDCNGTLIERSSAGQDS
jgi:hypothetical protein